MRTVLSVVSFMVKAIVFFFLNHYSWCWSIDAFNYCLQTISDIVLCAFLPEML